MRSEFGPQPGLICCREPVGVMRSIFRPHHLGQIDNRVARHGKGELRLFWMDAVDAGDDQRSYIEHRRHCSQPGLVGVLRPEEKQHRIGNVTRQEVGAPALPVAKNFVEHSLFGTAAQAAQKFGRFYSGALVLTVMFSAIFSTISIIEDRREGFLLSMLVSPAPRTRSEEHTS